MRTELSQAQRDWWNSEYPKLCKMLAKRHRIDGQDGNDWQEAISNSVAIAWQEFVRDPKRYVDDEKNMGAYHLARYSAFRTNRKGIVFGSEHKGRQSFERMLTRARTADTNDAMDDLASRELDPSMIVELRLDFAEWYSGLQPQERVVIQYLLGGHSLSGRSGIDGKLKTTLRSLRRMMRRLETRWCDYHAGILSLYAALQIIA